MKLEQLEREVAHLSRRCDALSMENAALAVRVANLEAQNAIKIAKAGPSHAGCGARPWDRQEDWSTPEGRERVRARRRAQIEAEIGR
jgi:hypothetical protein